MHSIIFSVNEMHTIHNKSKDSSAWPCLVNQCHSPHGLQRMRLAAYVYAWGFQEIKNLIANLSKKLVNKKAIECLAAQNPVLQISRSLNF